jgi:hypothetical protein
MSISTNAQHYFQAIVRGVANGSLFAKAQRYWSSRQVDRAVVKQYGLKIKNGPFAGINYIMIPPYRGLSAKLLGSYERELHPAFEEAIRTAYSVVINVGSAEGCYSVGYAVKVPRSTVYAFDIDPREQEFCHQLAAVNHVTDRVHIGAECTPEDFQKLINDSTLVLMDCEGCEDELLDPQKAPKLLQADIILEIHDFTDPTLNARIRSRFSASHTITEYAYHPRNPADVPEVAFLKTEAQRQLAVMERNTTAQNWLYLRRTAV